MNIYLVKNSFLSLICEYTLKSGQKFIDMNFLLEYSKYTMKIGQDYLDTRYNNSGHNGGVSVIYVAGQRSLVYS